LKDNTKISNAKKSIEKLENFLISLNSNLNNSNCFENKSFDLAPIEPKNMNYKNNDDDQIKLKN